MSDQQVDAGSGQIDTRVRDWSMWLHLSGLSVLVFPFGFLVGPLIIWLVKKDEIPALDQHGKNAVNWGLSALIYMMVAGLAVLIVIGFLLLPVVAVLMIVFPIIAAVKANKGELWSYPLTIRFLS